MPPKTITSIDKTRLRFTKPQFLELLRRLFFKYNGTTDLELINAGNRTEQFGTGAYDLNPGIYLEKEVGKSKETKDKYRVRRKESLKAAIIGNSKVLKFEKVYHRSRKIVLPADLIKIDFRPLQTKFSKVMKSEFPENGIVSLDNPLPRICFEYLGLKNIDELNTTQFPAEVKQVDTKEIIREWTDDFDQADKYENFTYFLASFFSVGEFSIKHGVIGIDLRESLAGNPKSFDAIEFGIHNRKEIVQKSSRNKLFRGKANMGEKREKHFYLYLDLIETNKKKKSVETRLNISAIFKKLSKIREQNIGKAVVQGVSQVEGFFSMELVLKRIYSTKDQSAYEKALAMRKCKNDKELYHFIEQEIFTKRYEHQDLSMYLVLHRNTFRVNHQIYDSFEKFVARKKQIRDLRYIAGNYRVWHFNTGQQVDQYGNFIQKIVQSIFIIKEDCTAYLMPYVPSEFTDDNMRKHMSHQPAVININQMDSENPKLCVVTFGGEDSGMSILNTAVFDYPRLANTPKFRRKKKTTFIPGQFSTVGYEETGTISNFVLMYKEDLEIENIFNLEKDPIALENDFRPLSFYLKKDDAFKADKRRKNKWTINGFLEKHEHLQLFYEEFKKLVVERKKNFWWVDEF